MRMRSKEKGKAYPQNILIKKITRIKPFINSKKCLMNVFLTSFQVTPRETNYCIWKGYWVHPDKAVMLLRRISNVLLQRNKNKKMKRLVTIKNKSSYKYLGLSKKNRASFIASLWTIKSRTSYFLEKPNCTHKTTRLFSKLI